MGSRQPAQWTFLYWHIHFHSSEDWQPGTRSTLVCFVVLGLLEGRDPSNNLFLCAMHKFLLPYPEINSIPLPRITTSYLCDRERILFGGITEGGLKFKLGMLMELLLTCSAVEPAVQGNRDNHLILSTYEWETALSEMHGSWWMKG
jgi:hypothetical protein